MSHWQTAELERLLDEGIVDASYIFAEPHDTRFVYVFESGGLFKIGFATHPKRRLSSANCGSPSPVRLVLTIPTDQYLWYESALHALFADKHHHGEWFTLTDADLELIRASEADPAILAGVTAPEDPRSMPAKAMRASGALCKDISQALGVSLSTAHRLYR